ncbi:MAG: glycoside hydrolase family 3 protein [Treponema sp.]|jgi:beta-N-acetylhexosaminidase|nr:glycoside hydrolase family 3 protein [Treponema sp.]
MTHNDFRRGLVFAVALAILASPLHSLNFFDEGTPEELAAAIEEAMTDDQALGQVFMLGWVGAEPSPLIMDWIRERNIGGVKIFGWNTEDTLRLARTVGDLQEESLRGAFGIPLLVATDQEGGWIRHVKGSTSETPGNMAIGASGYPRDAYLAGYYIGQELALLGININFAPTVDLFTNRRSALIGPRAFGSNPANVGILGAAFMRGQQAAGVIPTAKHYPGHGGTDLDSHGVLPTIDVSFETLWDRELVPYRMLVAEGLPALMSGHIAFPGARAASGRADASAPASLSAWFLQDVLRERMGYKGIIITDDLMMNGATQWAGSLSRTARQALLAGNDIILFSKTPNLYDPVWTLLSTSMRENSEFRQRVRDAARRTLLVKLRYLRGKQTPPFIPNLEKVEAGLSTPESTAFFLNLAARSATIVKPPQGEGGVFPVKPENAGRVLLTGQYLDFFKGGRAAFPGSISYWYSEEFDISDLLSYASRADTIIFCLSDTEGVRTLRNLRSLGKKIIVLSVLSPVHLESVSWVDGAVAVYNDALESLAAGFSAITGRIPAEGRLPYE